MIITGYLMLDTPEIVPDIAEYPISLVQHLWEKGCLSGMEFKRVIMRKCNYCETVSDVEDMYRAPDYALICVGCYDRD